MQRDHQRGEGVRLAYVPAVRRVRRLLGPANGKRRLCILKINCNNIAFIRRIKMLKNLKRNNEKLIQKIT